MTSLSYRKDCENMDEKELNDLIDEVLSLSYEQKVILLDLIRNLSHAESAED